MATYFLDTSAIVKRYILEQGQPWILSLCNPEQGHDLYISQATLLRLSQQSAGEDVSKALV